MAHPVNVATPELADFERPPVHVSVPPPAFVPMASVIEAELLTVLPYASSTVTAGCVPNAAPAVPPLGCVVKTNWLAVPAFTVKLLLVALVREPSVADRVNDPLLVGTRFENVATPPDAAAVNVDPLLRVPPVLIAIVTVELLPVTTLP
jgi:hypothetical protein